MQQVKKGDTVKVHYHGKLTNGTTFDSSEGREPLEFEVGGGMVIPGFDEGVTGMIIGEKKTVHIPADQALYSRQYYTMRETAAMFNVNQSLLRFWENEFDISL